MFSNLSSSASVSDPNDFACDLEVDEIRGSLFNHPGPSSPAVVYDIVSVNVLMCLPRVKTAIEEPCTMIEEMTKKVVIGQINATTL
jgi:hypothetical protein